MIKYLSLLFIFLLFAGSKKLSTQNTFFNLVNDTFFSFILVKYYSESSKDSHSYSTTLSFKKNVLYYEYDYKGFPGSKNEHKQINVSNSTIDKMKAKLKELSLCMNYQKSFTDNNKGYTVKSGINLSVCIDSKEYDLKVEGGSPADINDTVYNNISTFFNYVKSLFPIQKK